MAAGVAAALLVGVPSVFLGAASGAGAATPNLPVFPNNINVFPNRDFVNIQGYVEHTGQTAKVEVTRPGVGVVGSAIGTISGGDVAFEVNHPGGICWGAGTGLNITPDIQSGDVVSVSIAATPTASAVQEATVVQDVYASDAVQNGTTVTVAGHIGSNVLPANMEQRIIEPALVDTIVGKRDVRAVPGPMTPAARGGYSSSLEFNPAAQSFLATYIFDVEADAHTAANAGLGERAMAWEVTDAAGNRQGMTIAEFGEVGGPGMGGCPNGPLQSGPPAPTNIVAARVSGGITVNWTPAVGIPGTPAITGYEVTAVAQTLNGSEQTEIGKRIANPGATSTTINGLADAETYDVEVVSYSTVGKTFPAVHASVVTDSTNPIVSASPVGGSYPVAQQVTLTSNELGSDLYYTIDGTDPIANGDITATALHYTAPIGIASATTLKFAAFDPSGNVSDMVTEQYSITNDPVPAATSFTTSSVGLNAVTLNWNPADAGAPGLTISSYEIDVFTAVNSPSPIRTDSVGNVTTATISGLTGDTPYWFAISAKNNINSVYGAASPRLGPVTPQGMVVANAGPDQTGVVRNTTVPLSGAGSTVTGATYAWTQLLTGTQTAVDRVTLRSVAGRPQDAAFTLPFFKFPMVNSPLTFQLTVTANGTSKTDLVLITPRSDAVTITSAKWKAGDFRIIGVGSTVGSVITIRAAVTGLTYGTATVNATGAFDLRLRTGVPTTRPPAIVAESNMGGASTPFNVS
ncbi:MAG: fibronectin type III domain-containing protein [Ilumatobacteraceae bacterium]